jgi:hypothetical protein
VGLEICVLSSVETVSSNPSGSMDVCLLSGRGLGDELATRPEDSYRLWCVVACDVDPDLPTTTPQP